MVQKDVIENKSGNLTAVEEDILLQDIAGYSMF
jgi:hypothetical protein